MAEDVEYAAAQAVLAGQLDARDVVEAVVQEPFRHLARGDALRHADLARAGPEACGGAGGLDEAVDAGADDARAALRALESGLGRLARGLRAVEQMAEDVELRLQYTLVRFLVFAGERFERRIVARDAGAEKVQVLGEFLSIFHAGADGEDVAGHLVQDGGGHQRGGALHRPPHGTFPCGAEGLTRAPDGGDLPQSVQHLFHGVRTGA